MKAKTCAEAARHTPHPAGYVEHHQWMERMSKTHDQEQCPACGLWAIWTPKGDGA